MDRADVVIKEVETDEPFATYRNALELSFDVGNYLVRGGREIILKRDMDLLSDEEARWYLLGSVLNFLLHQRGLLVLHASIVRIEDTAVAFLGDSGAGKSTTAAAFLCEGDHVLSEDVAVIEQPTNPLVRPSFPAIKLAPETVEKMNVPVDSIPENDADLRRHYYRVLGGEWSDPVPLSRIYILEEGTEPTIESIDSRGSVMELVRNTYAIYGLERTSTSENNLMQCGKLAGSVPIKRLRRSISFESLPEVVALVKSDL